MAAGLRVENRREDEVKVIGAARATRELQQRGHGRAGGAVITYGSSAGRSALRGRREEEIGATVGQTRVYACVYVCVCMRVEE